MTGPSYPRPVPGSNAIGQFVIGTSTIGIIPAFDVWSTVISQYANSPVLTQLITNMAQYVDPNVSVGEFFDLIWNVDTAQGYGLDVWGQMVGVQRALQIQNSGVYAGFAEQGVTVDTFGPGGRSPFYSGAQLTTTFNLTDDSFRTLIFAKALANISDCSIPALNQLLLNLFPNRGNCYVTDGEDMTMTYTFRFVLSPVEVAIISETGVLPKPVGVAASVVQIF